jgi:alpha-1,3-mannosyl-glycoprotein beta-1,2-N-acetylglucosaminyltransferase
MRKDRLYVVGSLVLVVWIGMTYFLFVHRPKYLDAQHSAAEGESDRSRQLRARIQLMEQKMKSQKLENDALLSEVMRIRDREREEPPADLPPAPAKEGPAESAAEKEQKPAAAEVVPKEEVMPVLMFACNRPTVSKALDSLLACRKSKAKFPVIVSQDCGHAETKQALLAYGDQIVLLEQPDQSEISVPPNEKKFQGYFKIARHYGWALNETFHALGYSQVIVVEDDLEFAPDFFAYFEATLPVLREDKTLMCVSAWNDNGKEALIDESHPETLYRTVSISPLVHLYVLLVCHRSFIIGVGKKEDHF